MLQNEDPGGEIRAQWTTGLQSGVVIDVGSNISLEHVQKDRDKLVLATALTVGFASGSLINDTIPCRQRGQAIEPVGPLATFVVLFVEQRYKAHCVQNS